MPVKNHGCDDAREDAKRQDNDRDDHEPDEQPSRRVEETLAERGERRRDPVDLVHKVAAHPLSADVQKAPTIWWFATQTHQGTSPISAATTATTVALSRPGP